MNRTETTPSENDDDLLARAGQTLEQVELVLTHLGSSARTEITQILAGHDNDRGGYALLIDTVQLDAAALRRRHRNP